MKKIWFDGLSGDQTKLFGGLYSSILSYLLLRVLFMAIPRTMMSWPNDPTMASSSGVAIASSAAIPCSRLCRYIGKRNPPWNCRDLFLNRKGLLGRSDTSLILIMGVEKKERDAVQQDKCYRGGRVRLWTRHLGMRSAIGGVAEM